MARGLGRRPRVQAFAAAARSLACVRSHVHYKTRLLTHCVRYLSDGSLQLDMPRSIDKSHYDTGGLLLRRQKIVNDRTGRPFQVQDFLLGGCYELFAFRFRIGAYAPHGPRCIIFFLMLLFPGDVDAFTRTAFEQRGWPPLGRPLETPSVDPAAAQKNSSFSVLKQSSTTTFSPPNRAAALLDVHPVGVPTAGSFRTASTFVSSLTSIASRRHLQPSHAPPHAG